MKVYRIDGDNIARFEEAKSNQLGEAEMERSGRTVRAPIVVYFKDDSVFRTIPEQFKSEFIRNESKILQEVRVYLTQLGY